MSRRYGAIETNRYRKWQEPVVPVYDVTPPLRDRMITVIDGSGVPVRIRDDMPADYYRLVRGTLRW